MSVTLDHFRRLDVRPPKHGILMPEEQSIGHWGLFKIQARVEIFELRDLGETSFGYESEIITDKGRFRSATAAGDDLDKRIQNDMAALALHFGVEVDEIEYLQQ